MAVGADYPIATSLLAEFTPRRYRGPLLGAFVAMWFVGAAAAYVVGQFLPARRRRLAMDAGQRRAARPDHRARPHGHARVAALAGSSKGRDDEAHEVIHKVYGDP